MNVERNTGTAESLALQPGSRVSFLRVDTVGDETTYANADATVLGFITTPTDEEIIRTDRLPNTASATGRVHTIQVHDSPGEVVEQSSPHATWCTLIQHEDNYEPIEPGRGVLLFDPDTGNLFQGTCKLDAPASAVPVEYIAGGFRMFQAANTLQTALAA